MQKTKEIRSALQAELYDSALALALTLPDICAKVEYGKTSRDNYIKWFDELVAEKFMYSATILPDNVITNYQMINGADCYGLRCAFLHSGVCIIDFIFIQASKHVVCDS